MTRLYMDDYIEWPDRRQRQADPRTKRRTGWMRGRTRGASWRCRCWT